MRIKLKKSTSYAADYGDSFGRETVSDSVPSFAQTFAQVFGNIDVKRLQEPHVQQNMHNIALEAFALNNTNVGDFCEQLDQERVVKHASSDMLKRMDVVFDQVCMLND